MAKKQKAAGRLPDFPLPEGHYFHPQVVSPHAHHGESEGDRANIRLLQQVLGVPESGIYDEPTEEAVSQSNEDGSLVVDAQAWERLSKG